MILKAAVASDLSEIVDLTNLAFRGEIGWTLETKYIEGERTNLKALIADLEANPEAKLMIGREETNDELLGSVWLQPVHNGTWYMGLLAVRPDLQGRQLGRQMLAASEDVV